MGFLKDLARRGRDLAASSAVERLAEKYVSPFGRILSFDLNTSARCVEATVLLNGETDPITISVAGYEIAREDGAHYLILRDIHASRQWIEAAAREYIHNRRFRLPDQVAVLLGFLS